MAKPGPRPRPPLQVVREGNPGKRAVRAGVKVPPAELGPPDWLEEFPPVPVPARPKRPVRDPDTDAEAWADQLDRYARRVEAWTRIQLAADGSKRCRARASTEWARVVPLLEKTAGLGVVDHSTLVDYCVCVARLEWCERQLSREGLVVMGQRGPCRNPLTTVASQYRTQLKAYIGELGLSPSSRGRLSAPPEDDDGDDPFDA